MVMKDVLIFVSYFHTIHLQFFWEFIGRTTVKPLVKSREEPYGPPTFPPKLRWFKVFNDESVSAEILAAFEMLEVVNCSPIV